jgi:hypothetical protein
MPYKYLSFSQQNLYTMLFTYTFTPNGMTAEKYDTIIKKLEEAGAGAPNGRFYHVCYETVTILV